MRVRRFPKAASHTESTGYTVVKLLGCTAMHIWIDNTGLHCAGKCLEQSAQTDYDVRGLLQLATQIVYADRILFNGFEYDSIAQRSRETTEKILEAGLDASAIEISDVAYDAYALACESAAGEAASEIPFSFHPSEDKLLGCEPSNLPQDTEQMAEFVDLARLPVDSERLSRVRSHALDDKAVGAVKYMMAINGELRASVAVLMNEHRSWSSTESHQLNIFLRFYLNEALADQGFSTYSPAVGRAELMGRRNTFVLDALGNVVDKATEELRGSPLGVPSVFAALAERSKGDPQAVLSEAIDMRSKAGPLRAWLRRHIDAVRQDTPEGRLEIRQAIRDLGRELRMDLRLETPPSLLDAFELAFVVGIPAPTIPARKILEWLKHRLSKRRIAVLTDIVKATAFAENYDRTYAKLRKNCMEN